jgi:NAD(P)-dependent dehydrogenase (short-subunit alcohol dehydrogenase family)
MEARLFDISGRTAVVTGGGGVLCRAMAKELAMMGAFVAVLDLKKESAKTVCEEIIEAGGQAIGIECNVLDKKSLESALAEILDTFGGIDILVNGAGGNHPKATTSRETLDASDLRSGEGGSFFDLEPDGVQSVFNLNFLGTLLPTQVFARVMAERGRGVVVNISSMNAFRPLTKIPAYSAAKAAVSNFTMWLANHLAPANVRVNALAPGFFLTNQNRFLLTQPESGELTDRGNKIIAHTPMQRFGTPDDLLGTLVWLVSDASAFVTGVVIPVDGGFSAYSGI